MPTAEAVAQHFGRSADLVPDDSKAEGLAQRCSGQTVTEPGQRMLVPQADIARPALVQGLTAAGLDVTALVAYRTTIGSGGVPLRELLAEGAGGQRRRSTPSHLPARRPCATCWPASQQEGGAPVDLSALQHVVLACIGPVTADALQAAGLPPAGRGRQNKAWKGWSKP